MTYSTVTTGSRESRFYFYDELDRLWKATTLAGTPLYTYAYDANGNRTQEIAPGGTTTYSYESATDRIAQASGAGAKHYAHDAYGSRIWAWPTAYAGVLSHLYNELNRLIEVRDPVTQGDAADASQFRRACAVEPPAAYFATASFGTLNSFPSSFFTR